MRYLNLILSLCVAALLSACSKEYTVGSVGSVSVDSNAPIMVNASFDGTRGSDPMGLREMNDFGMSAIWNYGDTLVNRWFLTAQKVYKVIDDPVLETHHWVITPVAFWPFAGSLSFFFYTPYNDVNHPEIRFVDSHTGMPGVTFTPGNNPTTHYDFCAAAPLLERTQSDGALNVTFDHVLSRIHLFANYDGILPTGYFVMIDSVRFNNIYGSKTLFFKEDGTKYEWQDETGLTADASYTISRGATQLVSDSLVVKNAANDNHRQIYQSAGQLYLLPQQLSPEASLTVNYRIWAGDINNNPICMGIEEKTVKFPAGLEWPMGKRIKLNLTLGIGVSSTTVLSTSITDWVNSNNISNGGAPVEYE